VWRTDALLPLPLPRSLPELDAVSRTCGELKGAIRKTMDRADIVSARVRELDLARSRALQALDHSTRLSEAETCLQGAARALEQRDLQQAAEFVRRFDAAGTGREADMRPLRSELERLVGERLDGMWDGLREAAAAPEYLDSAVARNALAHASVMSKLGPVRARGGGAGADAERRGGGAGLEPGAGEVFGVCGVAVQGARGL
jgi:hypothetical protein